MVKNKYGDKPYSHPAIAAAVVEIWFGKHSAIGIQDFDTLKTIPLSMIGLAATAVWSTLL
jgi:hypothetical protein